MIPLRQTEAPLTVPVVNRVLVIANVVIFAVQLFLGGRAEMLVNIFGFVPARFLHPALYGFNVFEVSVTLVTSLFLHGGIVHLFGNMIYLWVFGGAVEDALGHGKYLLFFIMCGAIGSLAHTMVFTKSAVPSIGASGSIAGVLGAFFVLRPAARVVTLFPLVVYWAMAEIRAALFLPIWFGMQFFNGFLSLASTVRTTEVAGVAWWAHIGGFLFGAAAGAAARWRKR